MSARLGLIGAIAVLAIGVLAPAAMAGDAKVIICHKPDTPAEGTLEVAASRVDAHLAHGDYLGECGSVPAPKVLALAFTDLDGVPGFGSGDVLIAKLLDTSGDEVPSVGDTVRMGSYPTSLTPGPADFADWGLTSHVVTGIGSRPPAVWVEVETGAGSHHWVNVGDDESYWEETKEHDSGAFFRDSARLSDRDNVHVQAGSPSNPTVPVESVNQDRPSDDAFIDVVINP